MPFGRYAADGKEADRWIALAGRSIVWCLSRRLEPAYARSVAGTRCDAFGDTDSASAEPRRSFSARSPESPMPKSWPMLFSGSCAAPSTASCRCALCRQAAGARPSCRNGSGWTFFPRRAAVPREPRKSGPSRPPLRYGPSAAAPFACRLVQHIEAAIGVAPK